MRILGRFSGRLRSTRQTHTCIFPSNYVDSNGRFLRGPAESSKTFSKCVFNKFAFKVLRFVLTLGILSLVHTPSCSNRSRISQANIDGHSRLYSDILLTTSWVATRGFEPPMARGRMLPVS